MESTSCADSFERTNSRKSVKSACTEAFLPGVIEGTYSFLLSSGSSGIIMLEFLLSFKALCSLLSASVLV